MFLITTPSSHYDFVCMQENYAKTIFYIWPKGFWNPITLFFVVNTFLGTIFLNRLSFYWSVMCRYTMIISYPCYKYVHSHGSDSQKGPYFWSQSPIRLLLDWILGPISDTKCLLDNYLYTIWTYQIGDLGKAVPNPIVY